MQKQNIFPKVLSLSLIFLILGFTTVKAQEEKKTETLEWHTSLMKADELSRKTKKPIFAFFTGSDWCGWCIKLQNDVFAKPEFIEWAKKNVILLELDFPRRKQLSPELQQQNNSMQQAFNVSGYPTVWIFTTNKNNKDKKFTMDTYGSTGYPVGAEPGKEEVKFLNDVQDIILKKTLSQQPAK